MYIHIYINVNPKFIIGAPKIGNSHFIGALNDWVDILGAKNSLTSTATAPQTGGGKPCQKHKRPNPMHQAAF